MKRYVNVVCVCMTSQCVIHLQILDNLEERRKASPSAAFTLLKAVSNSLHIKLNI